MLKEILLLNSVSRPPGAMVLLVFPFSRGVMRSLPHRSANACFLQWVEGGGVKINGMANNLFFYVQTINKHKNLWHYNISTFLPFSALPPFAEIARCRVSG